MKLDDSDLAIAIGEDAFKAGWKAGWREGATGCNRTADQDWSDYTPPEELCGRNF